MLPLSLLINLESIQSWELGGTLTEKNIPSEPSVSPGGVQTVKNRPAMRETRVRSLGREDPLEKGKATHSSILAWRIPWTVEPGGLQSMGHKESDTTERLTQVQ